MEQLKPVIQQGGEVLSNPAVFTDNPTF
jgi:hypothetical protein